MRSNGIVIIYNDKKYAAVLANFTADRATSSGATGAPSHAAGGQKSNYNNIVLLVVLVCVLVPVILAAFVITIVVVVKNHQVELPRLLFLCHV